MAFRPIRPKPEIPVAPSVQDDVMYIIVMENESKTPVILETSPESVNNSEDVAVIEAKYPWYSLFQQAFSPHCGWVSNLEDATRVVRLHELHSNSEFTTYMCRRKNFGNTDIREKSHFIRFNDKLDAQQKIPGLKFDGVPFISLNIKKLDCHRGVNRNVISNKSEQAKEHDYEDKKKRKAQVTKKVDCPAQITIREIVRFPNYKIDQNLEWKRKQTSKKLRKDIEQSDVKFERRFYIYLPQSSDHKNHVQNGVAESATVIHQKLKEKIDELISDGVESISDIKHILLDFVNTQGHDFIINGSNPGITDRSFYPTEEDIQNYVSVSISENYHSEFDERNIEKKLQEWMENQNDDHLFYRPQASSKTDVNSYLSSGFLFVYQTEAHRLLLRRYGNDVCLLDSSYMVAKFALPVIFICVQTNVDYQPIAAFIILNESVKSIAEALNVVKEWNPEWSPKFFHTNFSELQIQAVEMTFPNTVVLLRDAYRDQKWDRWVSIKSNGVSDNQNEVLEYLKSIAYSETEEEFFKRIKVLKASPIWNSSPALQHFFLKVWFPEHKRWAWAFRKDALIINFKTNNGSEFRSLYMNLQKQRTLSGLLSVLKSNFFPAKIASYVSNNVSNPNLYKEIGKFVPNSHSERPKRLLMHLSKSLKNSRNIKPYCIQKIGDKAYVVKSENSNGSFYTVRFCNSNGMPSCDCIDWKKLNWPCKHFFAIFTHTNKKWLDLSSSYVNSIFLTLDPTIYTPEGQSIEIENSEVDMWNLELATNIVIESEHVEAPLLTAEDCRQTLDKIRSDSFNITESNVLQEFHEKLEGVRVWLNQHLVNQQETAKRFMNEELVNFDELAKRQRKL